MFYLLLSALVGRLVIRESIGGSSKYFTASEQHYAPQLGDTFLGGALPSLLVIMEFDCVRTYGCLRLFGGSVWIGEFIKIPRLAARQPSLYKVKSIVFIPVLAF